MNLPSRLLLAAAASIAAIAWACAQASDPPMEHITITGQRPQSDPPMEHITITGQRPQTESFSQCVEHEVWAGLHAPRTPLTLEQTVEQVGNFCKRFNASNASIAQEAGRRYQACKLIENRVTLPAWVDREPGLYTWLVERLRTRGYQCNSISGLSMYRASYVVSCNSHEAWFVVAPTGNVTGGI